MKKVLVIGGSGFIGGAYSKEIQKRGFQVINYDLPEHNILDEKDLLFKVKQADIVIHFAAMANVVECFDMQEETFNVNIRGVFNVARACCSECKPLIFISTCIVYGNSHDDVEV